MAIVLLETAAAAAVVVGMSLDDEGGSCFFLFFFSIASELPLFFLAKEVDETATLMGQSYELEME